MRKLSLSIYSLGYSAGFLGSSGESNLFGLDDLIVLARDLQIQGLEYPVDRYFSDDGPDGLSSCVKHCLENGLDSLFDFENFSADEVQKFLPVMAMHSSWFRAKVSTFYGGNRHLNARLYESDLAQFQISMRQLHPILKDYGLRVLVENHQDIVLADVFRMVDEFGEDVIGVNWDVGNSLPSGETPNTFLRKAAGIIGNVHLKDYKIFLNSEGFSMRRCALGEGFVDFAECLNELPVHVPLTVELGAWRARSANIRSVEYWNHTSGVTKQERVNFDAYINSIAEDGESRSEWELGLSGSKMRELELMQIKKSVSHLRSVLKSDQDD